MQSLDGGRKDGRREEKVSTFPSLFMEIVGHVALVMWSGPIQSRSGHMESAGADLDFSGHSQMRQLFAKHFLVSSSRPRNITDDHRQGM